MQYAAGLALEEAAEAGHAPRILWLGQPSLLTHSLLALLLWTLASAGCLALLAVRPGVELPLESEPQPLAVLLMLFPLLYTAMALHALRYTRGTVYALTESGAIALNLVPWLPTGSGGAVRITAYTQMLTDARTEPRTICCAADVIFANQATLSRPASKAGRAGSTAVSVAHPRRGPTRFAAVPRWQVASMRAVLDRQLLAVTSKASGGMELGPTPGAISRARARPAIEAIAVTSAQAERVPEINAAVVVTDLDALPRVPVHALTTSAAEYADALPDSASHGQLTERSDRTSSSDRAGRSFPTASPASARGVVA